jgi:hypothetical protein
MLRPGRKTHCDGSTSDSCDPLAWRGSLSVIASFNNYADDGALEGVSQPSVKVMEPCGDTDSPSVPHATVHDPDSSPHYGILDLGPTDEIPLTKTGFGRSRWRGGRHRVFAGRQFVLGRCKIASAGDNMRLCMKLGVNRFGS